MDYSRSIQALEKEKAAYERLLEYKVRSKVNYKKVIWELGSAIELLKSQSIQREVHHGAYRKI